MKFLENSFYFASILSVLLVIFLMNNYPDVPKPLIFIFFWIIFAIHKFFISIINKFSISEVQLDASVDNDKIIKNETSNLSDELSKLNQLKNEEAITEEEFKKAKEKLLR